MILCFAGMCGSCWAFSAIVAIEGAHFLDTGDLISLSEQELIDCDKTDMGCGGGLMDNAFLFDENATGICSEENYPYVMHKRWLMGCASEKGECTPVEHTRVKTFVDVENTVEALMEAIATQPISVAMYVWHAIIV
jgi:cathepsin L